jgi:hypothetical protein
VINKASSKLKLLNFTQSRDKQRKFKTKLLNFTQSRDNLAVKELNVPRPARKRSLRRPRFAGFAAFGGAGRVLQREREKSTGFGSGSVANRKEVEDLQC